MTGHYFHLQELLQLNSLKKINIIELQYQSSAKMFWNALSNNKGPMKPPAYRYLNSLNIQFRVRFRMNLLFQSLLILSLWKKNMHINVIRFNMSQ